MTKIIQVTAAVLARDAKVLIAQRKNSDHLSGLWEFPGGKIEPGERPEQSLERELREEFDIDVTIGEYIGSNIHHYDHISIELMAFHSTWTSGELKVNDHAATKWVTVEQLGQYDFAPADIPFVEKLRSGELKL